MQDNDRVNTIRYYISGYPASSITIDPQYDDIEMIYNITCN